MSSSRNNEALPFLVKPLNKTFGAVVHDLDLSSLSDTDFEALYQVWLDYALLIFPELKLTEDEQIAFASRFGSLVPELKAAPITNVMPDGSLRQASDDDMMKIIRGNMHWHQDDTYQAVQAKGAVFSGTVTPSAGGETGFVDMRAAWSALDPELRDQLSSLTAKHSLAHSQKKLGEQTKSSDSEYHGYGLDVKDIPVRPLVKVHPETGTPSLAVGRHAYGVEGMAEAESDQLIADLIAFAASDESRVYEHIWSDGDALLWDNRCLMHRASPWDFSQPRVMLHSRIAGDPVTELAPNLRR